MLSVVIIGSRQLAVGNETALFAAHVFTVNCKLMVANFLLLTTAIVQI